MPAQSEAVRPNLADLAKEFLIFLKTVRHYSPATVCAYGADLGQFGRWLADNGRPDAPLDLRPADFHAYAAHLAAHYAPATVRRKLDAISSLYRHQVATGRLTINPLATVPRPQRSRKIPAIPTPDECRRILAACVTPRERAVMLLLITTGIRRGELISLNCEDLAPDLSSMTVTGKGNKQRCLPLPPVTREALRTYLAERPEPGGPLILNQANRRIGTTSLRRLFAQVVRRAGFAEREWTMHTMRHLFATRMLRSGCGLPELRELLGHESGEAVLAYLHSDPATKQRSVARWADELTAEAANAAPMAATNEEDH